MHRFNLAVEDESIPSFQAKERSWKPWYRKFFGMLSKWWSAGYEYQATAVRALPRPSFVPSPSAIAFSRGVQKDRSKPHASSQHSSPIAINLIFNTYTKIKIRGAALMTSIQGLHTGVYRLARQNWTRETTSGHQFSRFTRGTGTNHHSYSSSGHRQLTSKSNQNSNSKLRKMRT